MYDFYRSSAKLAPVNDDVILYARWTDLPLQTYALFYSATSFQLNGQSSSFTRITGEPYGDFINLRSFGEDVAGWFSAPNGQGVEIFPHTVVDEHSPRVLYPLFISNIIILPPVPIQARIIFYFNARGINNRFEATIRQGIAPNEPYTIPSEIPFRAGYDFLGWASHADGTGTVLQPGEQFVPTPNQMIELHAQWERDEPTITYNLNGGFSLTPIIDNTLYRDGEKLTVSTITPEKIGFDFNNWNTKPDGTGAMHVAGSYIIVEDYITLFAQWEDLGGSHNVQARVVEGNLRNAVYSVDIEWGPMLFVFNNGLCDWIPDDAEFTVLAAAGWSIDNRLETDGVPTEYYLTNNNNRITVRNRSNAAIDAVFTYKTNNNTTFNDNTGVDNVVGGFYANETAAQAGALVLTNPTANPAFNTLPDSKVSLPTAVGRFNTPITLANVYFAYSGRPDAGKSETISSYILTGTITISFSPNLCEILNTPGN
jgi:hypothetical protein